MGLASSGLRWLVNGLTGGLLFAATAEIAVRVIHPTPRMQIVRASVLAPHGGITLREGQPTWREQGSAERIREGCVREGSRNLIVVGSSISFGINLPAADVFSTHLQRALNRREDGPWCVLNFAQPAYILDNTVADLRDHLARFSAEAVILEVWDVGVFVRVGEDFFNVGEAETGPSGLPEPLPLPPLAHRWLVERSAAWSYLTLATADRKRDVDLVGRRARARLDEARALAVDAGARLFIWFPAPLSGPIDAARLTSLHDKAPARDWVHASGVPALDLVQEWDGLDPRGLALDDVHLNAEGQRRLAERMLRWFAEEGLTPPATAGSTPPGP